MVEVNGRREREWKGVGREGGGLYRERFRLKILLESQGAAGEKVLPGLLANVTFV